MCISNCGHTSSHGTSRQCFETEESGTSLCGAAAAGGGAPHGSGARRRSGRWASGLREGAGNIDIQTDSTNPDFIQTREKTKIVLGNAISQIA